MALLANAHALLLDLRRNNGGASTGVAALHGLSLPEGATTDPGAAVLTTVVGQDLDEDADGVFRIARRVEATAGNSGDAVVAENSSPTSSTRRRHQHDSARPDPADHPHQYWVGRCAHPAGLDHVDLHR